MSKHFVNPLVDTKRFMFMVVVSVLLAGCEPPLVMDGVKAKKAKPIHRSDNFQSIAHDGSNIVVVGASGAAITSGDAGQNWARTVLDGQPFLMDADVCPDGSFVTVDYQQNLWMLETIDGQWQRRDIDSRETPQAITCDERGRIWVVGGFSSILRSDDRGESWSEDSLDRDLYFTTVQFVDADHGLLTGEFGVVARTVDGGETWDMLEPVPDDFYPQDAWFATPERGWVVGLRGTVFYTADGAETWQKRETGTNYPIHSIIPNGDSLYAVGSNGLVLSCRRCITDQTGTASWQTIEHDLPIRFYLRGVAHVDGSLWVAGGAGALQSLPVSRAGGYSQNDKAHTSGGAQ